MEATNSSALCIRNELPFRSGPAFLPSAMGKETRRDGADLVLAQRQTTAGEDAPKPVDKKPLQVMQFKKYISTNN